MVCLARLKLQFRLCFTILSLIISAYDVHAVYISTVQDVSISDETLPGYVGVYAANSTQCLRLCQGLLTCKGFTYRFPTTCSLFQTTTYWLPMQGATSGVKVSSTIRSNPISFTSFSPSDDFLLVGSPIIVESKLKLAFRESQGGYATLLEPVEFFKFNKSQCTAASFQTSFAFQIKPLSVDGSGDGFTFFLSSTSGLTQSQSSYLGLPQGIDYQGIAIEFDTFQDESYNDRDYSHVGIDISFNSTSNVAASTLPLGFRLNDTRVKYCWIDYNNSISVLSVFLSTSKTKPTSPLLKYSINLCQYFHPTTCPTCSQRRTLYPGFSVSTSYSYFQAVDILSWSLVTTWPSKLPGPPSTCLALPGLYWSGGDLNNFFSLSAASCCSKCKQFPGCQNYAYYSSAKQCYLRESASSIGTDSDAVSGYIPPVPVPFPASFKFPSFGSSSGLDLRSAPLYDGNSLVLTYDSNQLGYAYLPNPVQILRDNNNLCLPLSFKSRFTFLIQNGNADGFASGFTFFLLGGNIVDRSSIQTSDPSDLGLYYTSNTETIPGILAVEFDTFKDSVVKDKEAGHVGINVQFGGVSAVSVATKALGFPLFDLKVKTVWVQYWASNKTLGVYLSYGSTQPSSPILQYKVDMCQLLRSFCAGCWELNSVYVGFSAVTSTIFETVTIKSWQFDTYL